MLAVLPHNRAGSEQDVLDADAIQGIVCGGLCGRLRQARSQGTGLEVSHEVQDAKDNGVDAEQPDQGDQPGIGPDGDKNAEADRDDPGQP